MSAHDSGQAEVMIGRSDVPQSGLLCLAKDEAYCN